MNKQKCVTTHDRLSVTFTPFMFMIGLEQHCRYGECTTEGKTEESGFDFRNTTDISSFLEASKLASAHLLTYLLTPWNRVLLEKLTSSAASQEIPRIFGTPRFITVLTSARHLSLS